VYAESGCLFVRAAELDAADFIYRSEKPLRGLVKTLGDVVDDVLGAKSRVFQTVCLEGQKPNTSISVFILLINSRAFLVTVVAPSKRPVTLHYWGG
jgi:hypothetical protein